jgi:NADPH-dependent 2,4-dienoyl-CoA reductase/sulfur reductase-like enzyme
MNAWVCSHSMLLLIFLLLATTRGFKQVATSRIGQSKLKSSSAPEIRKYTLQGTEKIPHAVIAGGGPAGLLTALCLLSRGYRVTLHEAREDPTKTPLGPRAFSL